MSLETWKKEFYPISAKEIVKQYRQGLVNQKALILHCLTKWTGLRDEFLEKHGLQKVQEEIFEKENADECFYIDCDSCALCIFTRNKRGEEICRKCPLAISRGGVPCDEETEDESESRTLTPYHSLSEAGDPEPMIEALKNCLNS